MAPGGTIHVYGAGTKYRGSTIYGAIPYGALSTMAPGGTIHVYGAGTKYRTGTIYGAPIIKVVILV